MAPHLDGAAVGDRHCPAIATIAAIATDLEGGAVVQAVAATGEGEAATAATDRLAKEAMGLAAGGEDGAAVGEGDGTPDTSTASGATDLKRSHHVGAPFGISQADPGAAAATADALGIEANGIDACRDQVTRVGGADPAAIATVATGTTDAAAELHPGSLRATGHSVGKTTTATNALQ